MKKHKILVFTFLLFAFCTAILVGCDNADDGPVTIEEFKVNEYSETVDIGTEYDLGKVYAIDNKGNYHIAEVNVIHRSKDDIEKPVETTKTSSGKSKLLCSEFGTYVITYTITYNDGEKMSKSYELKIDDFSGPTVKTSLYSHNIGTVGQQISLDDFVVTDNSGEDITYEISVKFNNEKDESAVVDGVLTLEKEGCYTITVSAEDSHENAVEKEYDIYTLMDFEHKRYFPNETYLSSITGDTAYDGTSCYEFDAFGRYPSYFNDYSMLGRLLILDDSMRYVSFWIKFEDENYSNVLKARYHETIIYDQFGDELPKYVLSYDDGREDYEGYELFGNTWYKVVIDLTNVVKKGEIEDIAEVTANPMSLDLIPLYWGVWDPINNNNADKSQSVYIDNIMLTNDPLSGFKAPQKSDYPFPENCIADFESDDQLTALSPSWNTKVSLSDEISEGNKVLKFVPYAMWSSFGMKGLLGIDELNTYNSITAKVYVKDESDTSIYDEENHVVVVLRYRLDDGTYEDIASASVMTSGEWVDVDFALGIYNQYSLSGRDFDICVYKIIDGEPIETGEYNGEVTIYMDDLYVN